MGLVVGGEWEVQVIGKILTLLFAPTPGSLKYF
jgi:hypothetical protein